MSPQRKTVLGVLLVLAGLTTLWLLDAVIATVFFAVTVAYVLYPLRQRLLAAGAGRRVAAAVVTAVAFLAGLAAVTPLAVVLYLRRGQLIDLLRTVPPEVVVEAFGVVLTLDLGSYVPVVQRTLTGLALAIAAALPVIALKAALFTLVLYGLLVYPHRVAAAVVRPVPVAYHGVLRALHGRTRRTLNAIYVLQAATAAGTFLAALVLFWALGYQSAFTLAVIAGVLQFVPIVGPSLLVLALAAFQLAAGDVTAAALVAVFGLVLVGFLPDALIRPRLASLATDLPGTLYFVGFTGGVLSLGLVGFIAGPLVVALLAELALLLSAESGPLAGSDGA